MKHLLAVGALAVAALAFQPAQAEDMSGNVQFLVGQRWLDDAWKPLDQPAMFGVEVDFAPESSPIHVALAAMIAGDSQRITGNFYGDTGDVDLGFFELSAGFLWVPVKKGVVRPYIGAGVVLMGAGIGSNWTWFDAKDSDHSFGFYGNAGVFFKVGDTFNIGMDGRIVQGAKFTFAGQELDGDYTQAALLLGFSFGK
jgi:hypothetical protein